MLTGAMTSQMLTVAYVSNGTEQKDLHKGRRLCRSSTPKIASVAAHAIEVMQVEEEDEEEGGEPRIFRNDGTVVPDGSIDDLPWTISRYLKSLNKYPAQVKLGVGFYCRVSMPTPIATFLLF